MTTTESITSTTPTYSPRSTFSATSTASTASAVSTKSTTSAKTTTRTLATTQAPSAISTTMLQMALQPRHRRRRCNPNPNANKRTPPPVFALVAFVTAVLVAARVTVAEAGATGRGDRSVPWWYPSRDWGTPSDQKAGGGDGGYGSWAGLSHLRHRCGGWDMGG